MLAALAGHAGVGRRLGAHTLRAERWAVALPLFGLACCWRMTAPASARPRACRVFTPVGFRRACLQRAPCQNKRGVWRAQEPILALRRQLAVLSGAEGDAGQCWLQHAQVPATCTLVLTFSLQKQQTACMYCDVRRQRCRKHGGACAGAAVVTRRLQ